MLDSLERRYQGKRLVLGQAVAIASPLNKSDSKVQEYQIAREGRVLQIDDRTDEGYEDNIPKILYIASSSMGRLRKRILHASGPFRLIMQRSVSQSTWTGCMYS